MTRPTTLLEEDQQKRRLWAALTTRVLSFEELLEVGRYKNNLNVFLDEPYTYPENLLELNNALLIQQLLRMQRSDKLL
jgi:hypothetical protein